MTRTYQQWRETLNRLARAGPRAAPFADRVLDGASVGDEDALGLGLAEDEARIMKHVAPLSAPWTPNEVVPPQSGPAAASDGAAAQATADAADAFVRAHQRKGG